MKATAGIDIGSLTTEAVLLQGTEILAYSITGTGANACRAAERVFDEVLKKAGLTAGEIAYIVATGYGRRRISFAQRQVTEITCHARGAFFLFPQARTVIDIGGQDSKVIRIGENGSVIDFLMNDKCAAGTGRFLEVMAQALGLPVTALGEIDSQATQIAEISSMCTVFAESEVISLIAQGVSQAEIVQGLHRAVARRTASLIHRLGLLPGVIMTGGVAKNRGVVSSLSRELGVKIFVPFEPQIVGALGAALIAQG